MKENKKIEFITKAGIIAAAYVVLTMVLAPFSFGEVQVRVSEALTILPLFTPAAIPGLFLGCLLGNFMGGAVVPDIVFGSIATLLGAIGTYLLKGVAKNNREYIGAIPPIIANTLIVPFVLKYAYGVPLPIPLMMLTVGIGEVISCGILGTLLAKALTKRGGELLR